MINSRSIAFGTALLIAVITTAFLSMVPSIPRLGLILCTFLSFGSSYLLIRIVIDIFFFRHINTLYDILDQIKEKDFSAVSGLSTPSRGLNPMRDINNEIYDYAAKKQEEIERLRQLEIFRREFIADISHELKTPIFAAQGFVHTLLDGAVKDKTVRDKFLKKAARSLDGLDILVQDLLTISQMERGEIRMHFEHFNIVALGAKVLEQMEGKADKRKLKVQYHNHLKEPLFVYADYQRIYQVLTNLVSNAIKYSKKNATFEVGFTEEGTYIKGWVKDHGIGIPEDDLARIFERFYRVDKSRSKEMGGTGLGLAIVKHIMEKHHTKVEVESKLGQGATFSFRLPKGEPVEWEEDYDEEEEEIEYQ